MDKKLRFLGDIADRMLSVGCSQDVAFFIACQFALESNFGRSRKAVDKHNLCGMRVPSLRPSTNIGVTGFANYVSDDECVLDYILWLSYSRFNVFDLRDLETFKIKLKAKHYCDSPDYIPSIENLYEQFKNL